MSFLNRAPLSLEWHHTFHSQLMKHGANSCSVFATGTHLEYPERRFHHMKVLNKKTVEIFPREGNKHMYKIRK